MLPALMALKKLSLAYELGESHTLALTVVVVKSAVETGAVVEVEEVEEDEEK
jgi:hypothetical protein